MSKIEEYAHEIKNAIWARNVRDAIANAFTLLKNAPEEIETLTSTYKSLSGKVQGMTKKISDLETKITDVQTSAENLEKNSSLMAGIDASTYTANTTIPLNNVYNLLQNTSTVKYENGKITLTPGIYRIELYGLITAGAFCLSPIQNINLDTTKRYASYVVKVSTGSLVLTPTATAKTSILAGANVGICITRLGDAS